MTKEPILYNVVLDTKLMENHEPAPYRLVPPSFVHALDETGIVFAEKSKFKIPIFVLLLTTLLTGFFWPIAFGWLFAASCCLVLIAGQELDIKAKKRNKRLESEFAEPFDRFRIIALKNCLRLVKYTAQHKKGGLPAYKAITLEEIDVSEKNFEQIEAFYQKAIDLENTSQTLLLEAQHAEDLNKMVLEQINKSHV